jgi:hypothetical protein
LLSHLTSVLAVVQQHQMDLAQGVSYLSSAVTGFSSIGYSGPNDAAQTWGNIYANLLGAGGAYGALGNCAALDAALDAVLGPDPTPCDQRTGPPVGSPSAAPSGGPAISSGADAPSGASSTSSSAAATSSSADQAGAPANPLTQLLGPLVGGKS